MQKSTWEKGNMWTYVFWDDNCVNSLSTHRNSEETQENKAAAIMVLDFLVL